MDPTPAVDTPESTESSAEEDGDEGSEADDELNDDKSEGDSSSDVEVEADDDDEEDDEDADNGHHHQPEIQVEFEARTPEQMDFAGVKRFLVKLFNHSNKIDYTALTDQVIQQRAVGSVVTQSYNDYSDDDDDEDGGGGGGAGNGLPSSAEISKEVYGLATVVKLDRERNLTKSIIEYLVQITRKDENNLSKLSALLSNDSSKSVGLIISERIMNIPPQLSVPLYETLFNEIRKARAKNIPNFDFTHYALMCRTLTPPGLEEGSPEATGSTLYQNPEEEVIREECDDVIRVDLLGENEGGSNNMVAISGVTYRTDCCLLVFKADKTGHIWERIRESFPIPT